jgi:hypothetical protein
MIVIIKIELSDKNINRIKYNNIFSFVRNSFWTFCNSSVAVVVTKYVRRVNLIINVPYTRDSNEST